MSSRILSKTPVQSKPPSGDLPLQFYKGVGPARAQLLAKMGLITPRDVLFYFPRDWEDRRHLYTLREAPQAGRVTLRGILGEPKFMTLRRDLGVISAVLEDGSHSILCVWYKKMNPRYDVFAPLRQKLRAGSQMMVFGAVEWGAQGREIRVEEFAVLPEGESLPTADDAIHINRIVPLYSVTEGISEKFLRTLIASVLKSVPIPSSAVPRSISQEKKLPATAWSYTTIHFPETLIEKEKARQALAFEEFFLLETALGLLRSQTKKVEKPHVYQLQKHLLTPFRENLGFPFTAAQKRVIREVFEDMQRPAPMNRLLQGDVGSGKTVVALSAMLLAVENGGQAALMAPTEILAEQHAATFRRLLDHLPVRSVVLTGGGAKAERKQALSDIAEGRVDLIIGTHALLEKPVRFHRLMLAVIDEQHRFGVAHRRLLREKGIVPDVLVMTATPIPRTLALTVYGDLDCSVIDELPPGRSPIQTEHLSEGHAYQRVREAVAQGRQAYLVYPLVEESDKLELKAAVQEAETLRKTVFTGLRVGLLHGQMSSKEKDTVMDHFRLRRLDILLATTVIEVGIDVPNATVMVVHHAERFGLSTLHQLRGRVGRGGGASSCLLIAEVKGDDARKRIAIMTQTTDGFVISEEDLAMRGPGEVLGAHQHGIPEFRLGNIIQDARLIHEARNASSTILEQDPELKRADHAALRMAVKTIYGNRWALGSTG